MTPDATAAMHMAEPGWLWLLPVPLLVWWWGWLRRRRLQQGRAVAYADPHLLPYLMLPSRGDGGRRRLALWSLIWVLGVVAMAGPRFGYRDVALLRPEGSIVVLLDLSRSMLATDVRPSRIDRARQEVDDLLSVRGGLRVGLVGFASVAHVIAPVTDDEDTVRHLLPAVNASLVHWGGSRVEDGMDRARRLLAAQPGDGPRAVVLVSDGDFESPALDAEVRALRAAGATLHVLGVGTADGAQVPDGRGGVLRDGRGQLVVSRLEESRLRALAEAGGGLYRGAGFRDDDVRSLVEAILGEGQGSALARGGALRIWSERFPLLVIPMLLALAWWWRRAAMPLRGAGGASSTAGSTR